MWVLLGFQMENDLKAFIIVKVAQMKYSSQV